MVKAKLKMYINPNHALFYITTCGLLALSLGGNIRGGAEASPLETASFLDAMELDRQESSIASSLREDSWHRSLAANNCMDDLYSGNAGCTANDFEFMGVTGVTVNDPGAYLNTTSGQWVGDAGEKTTT
jgi:hypothetical protein